MYFIYVIFLHLAAVKYMLNNNEKNFIENAKLAEAGLDTEAEED